MARVAMSEMPEISLAEEELEKDVAQCARMIFSTPKGSVPYMRGFGIEPGLVDNRITQDINEIVDESYEQVERYEPRMDLEDVEQEVDAMTGNVDIIISYTLEDEDDDEDDEEGEEDE